MEQGALFLRGFFGYGGIAFAFLAIQETSLANATVAQQVTYLLIHSVIPTSNQCLLQSHPSQLTCLTRYKCPDNTSVCGTSVALLLS